MQVAMEIRDHPGAKINYDQLQRKILASEPPFASDLEAQVKFAKVWGGGKEQPITQEICAFIKLAENDHRVTPACFTACSTLRVDPLNLPTQFVAACIKTAATRGKSRDGASAHLGPKEIKRIVGDKKTKSRLQTVS